MSGIVPDETRTFASGHQAAQVNPPTTEELTFMHQFTDRLYDWLREQPDVADVHNLDGSILGLRLAGTGDVSISVTPTGHV
jgi:hypothetical protein